VIAARRVARVRGKLSTFAFRKRRLRDGFYSVIVRGQRGGATRIALRRRGGRFAKRPPFVVSRRCGAVRRLALSGPVFGGARARPLRVGYRVSGTGTARVVVARRGGGVVRTFTARKVTAGRLQSVTLPAKGLARGNYRISVVSSGTDGRRTTATARAFRL